MSEVPPGCGPHRKAASFWLSPMLSIEQMFLCVKDIRKKWGSLETAEDFHLFYSHAKFEANFSGINTMSCLLPVLLRRNAASLPKRLAEVVGTIKTAEFGNFGECLVTVDQYHGFP